MALPPVTIAAAGVAGTVGHTSYRRPQVALGGSGLIVAFNWYYGNTTFFGKVIVSAATVEAWRRDLENLNNRIADQQQKIRDIEDASRRQKGGCGPYDTSKSEQLLQQLEQEAADLAAKIAGAGG